MFTNVYFCKHDYMKNMYNCDNHKIFGELYRIC